MELLIEISADISAKIEKEDKEHSYVATKIKVKSVGVNVAGEIPAFVQEDLLRPLTIDTILQALHMTVADKKTNPICEKDKKGILLIKNFLKYYKSEYINQK